MFRVGLKLVCHEENVRSEAKHLPRTVYFVWAHSVFGLQLLASVDSVAQGSRFIKVNPPHPTWTSIPPTHIHLKSISIIGQCHFYFRNFGPNTHTIRMNELKGLSNCYAMQLPKISQCLLTVVFISMHLYIYVCECVCTGVELVRFQRGLFLECQFLFALFLCVILSGSVSLSGPVAVLFRDV